MSNPSNLQRSTAGVRNAIAVMRRNLAEASAKAGDALVLIERMVQEVEAGSHPLFMPEESPCVRRPLRPHWDNWMAALEQLADACGAEVQCSPKWNQIRVTAGSCRTNDLAMAFADIGYFVEIASDMDGQAVKDVLRAKVQTRFSVGHSPYIALNDIPSPWREMFPIFLRGSGAPFVEGMGQCAWPADWERWLDEDWRGWWRQLNASWISHAMGSGVRRS